MTNPNETPNERPSAYRGAPHWAAVLAAVLTLPLLYVGGSVTTYRVGMAVPDWPRTFGENMFTYNFWDAPFGVRLEHSHRLYGSAVGLATIALCAAFFIYDRRKWARGLAVAALAIVLVQGFLGGYRVWFNSTVVAALHGCLAQIFFALTVALATFTGRDWLSDAKPTPDARGVRGLAVITVLLIAAQIGLGAVLRHFSGRHSAYTHAVLGVAILGVAAHLFVKTKRHDPPKPALRSAARWVEVLAGVQILLGLVAFVMLWPFDGMPRPVSFSQAVVRTLHQTNGAVLLAASVVATLRAFRHFGPATSHGSILPPSTSPTDLEAVA